MSSPQKIEERDGMVGLEEDESECIEETPINQSYMQESIINSYPSLTTSSSIPTVDSSNTLIGSGSSPGLFSSQYTGTGVSLEANETGASLLHAVPSTSSLLHESSGLFMKRVSVCDRSSGRRGVSIETQTSKTEGNLGGGYYSPSPVVLLDQLIQHGEMVHRGNPHDIPLTELEGIDWFRFGSCPHSEELGQMQCQVAMLHSQLLFERHQCLQHDRRNRRLLSKARNAHRVREELEQLRNQCWQESFNVRQSLEHQMEQGVGGEMVGERGEAQRLREENRALLEENKLLQENNHRLTVELCRIQQEKSRLTSEAKEMREKMFVMESELADLKPRLAQTGSLLKKVAVLERELLVYNQMYKNQREESLSLLAHSKAQHEWTQLTKILKEEKEVAERERARFEQETEGLKNVVASLRDEGQRTQEERAVLQQILQHVQGRCQEKIKASEEKYEAMVAVTHQLESHITELTARNFTKKKTTSHQHKQSSSHPAVHRTGSSPTSHTTPSPVTSHTPSFSLDSSI